jgi:uncharacterized protein YjbJ (UPF0337 family)
VQPPSFAGTNLSDNGFKLAVPRAVDASARQGDFHMDWNQVEGNWKQMKGKVKEQWGKLTDDDLTQINGKREQLEGKIQERYGIQKDIAKKQIDDWYQRSM